MLYNVRNEALDERVQLHFVREEARKKLRRLTKREQQVLLYTVIGLPNKLISYRLGVSQRTIENHRLKIVNKTKCKSLPALLSILILGKKSCLPYCILENTCLRSNASCEMKNIFTKNMG